MNLRWPHVSTGRVSTRVVVAAIALLAAFACVLLLARGSSADPSLGQLNSELGQEQSRQQTLKEKIGSLSQLIDQLDGQISLVENREAAVRDQLSREQTQLTQTRGSLSMERKLLVVLRARLARAQKLLAGQLVSNYEGDKPDLVTVVLNAHGFSDLLEQISFLQRAEKQQQSVITLTRQARAQANTAAARLARLEKTQTEIEAATAIRVRALAGMNALLQSREDALADARDAQQQALAASRQKGQQLQSAIDRVQAEQAAAERAAAASPSPSSVALGAGGSWVIPYSIVLCESGGQNLPPNWAGASGYYQIIPSTWTGFGGVGPAAYLTSKAEQDQVAARIWDGGAGARNWDCAKIVGII